MATLHDILNIIFAAAEQTGHSFEQDMFEQIERQIRMQHGGDRVYVSPLESRKDPARAKKITEASKKLPTAVVAERFGVSRSYALRLRGIMKK